MSLVTIFRRALFLTLLSLLVMAGRSAQAQIKFELQPIGMDVTPGTAVTQSFTALLVNQYNQDVYITGGFGTSDSPLTLDDTAFQDFFFPLDANGDYLPLTPFKAGDTLTVKIFDASMPANAGQGTYKGVYDITYGFDPMDMGSDVAASFFANVSDTPIVPDVPEPGAFALFVSMGLMSAPLLAWRRRSRR